MAEREQNGTYGTNGKTVAELAEGLVREGNHKEAAARVSQELQNLSRDFSQSNYIDDTAIASGLQLRDELKRLREKGDPTLLYELEQLPEFKENQNVYQGQANLAEMAQVGREAYRNLADIQEQEMQKEQKEQLLLDIMVGEAANAMKIHNELQDALQTLEKKQDSLEAADEFRDFFQGTDGLNALAQETQAELSEKFKNEFTSQRTFVDIFNEASAKEETRQKARSRELEKEKVNENEAPVLASEDRRRKLSREAGMNR